MSNKPILKQLTQVAMVVEDIDTTVKHYWHDLGIDPWHLYTLDPGNTEHMRLQGRPVKHAFRVALASVGDMPGSLFNRWRAIAFMHNVLPSTARVYIMWLLLPRIATRRQCQYWRKKAIVKSSREKCLAMAVTAILIPINTWGLLPS